MKKKLIFVQILGGEKLFKILRSAGEIFLSGLRGAKYFSNTFRIVFSDLFRVFQTVFRIDLKVFSRAISFCRHAALKKQICFHNVQAIRANHFEPAIRNVLVPQKFQRNLKKKRGVQFSSGICESIRANRAI